MLDLNPERARIFRILHLANIAWILDRDGLHCQNSTTQDPNYVNIGNPSLIDKRARRIVPIPPDGTLSDYVPFYFTPFSLMMYNIKTGYGGITRRDNQDIVMLVSSVQRLRELGLSFIYTNQHAYSVDAEFYDGSDDLRQIDWPLLQRRDFKTDDADPGKQLRYQAEALVHSHVPLEAVIGIGCYNDTVKRSVESLLEVRDVRIPVKATPNWYF
jgi:ssDNA thymidine ADP-ribosyltransferase DarT-like protein